MLNLIEKTNLISLTDAHEEFTAHAWADHQHFVDGRYIGQQTLKNVITKYMAQHNSQLGIDYFYGFETVNRALSPMVFYTRSLIDNVRSALTNQEIKTAKHYQLANLVLTSDKVIYTYPKFDEVNEEVDPLIEVKPNLDKLIEPWLALDKTAAVSLMHRAVIAVISQETDYPNPMLAIDNNRVLYCNQSLLTEVKDKLSL